MDYQPLPATTVTSRRSRSSGILCHISSLPGQWGVGDLGQSAQAFCDWLATAGQSLWQMLPLGPPGFAESPYQCLSAFAGNPLYIGLDRLVDEGWLSAKELESAPAFSVEEVDFERVRGFRDWCLARANAAFQSSASPALRAEFDVFRHEHAEWLEDFSLFSALKSVHGQRSWVEWNDARAARPETARRHLSSKLAADVEQVSLIQFHFHRQFRELRIHARTCGISLMGDLPIFVAHDSADVWSNQDLFELNARGEPLVVAGVPPDYFSQTGQQWGNPLYRWSLMRGDGYAWWRRRMRHTLSQFDLVRIDHFRGFEAYWEIPGAAPTAADGRWVPGPGREFFRCILDELGELPLVAEDLGVITPDVESLRDDLGFPGMRILQFAFGDDPKAPDYRPHNYPRNTVVYTGTHDNDTTQGWFHSSAGAGSTRSAEQIAAERAFVLKYLGTNGTEIHWDLIRLALASVADTAMFPLQDVLGLGTEARMNLPGTSSGNWKWRFPAERITESLAARLAELSTTYDRIRPNDRFVAEDGR